MRNIFKEMNNAIRFHNLMHRAFRKSKKSMYRQYTNPLDVAEDENIVIDGLNKASPAVQKAFFDLIGGGKVEIADTLLRHEMLHKAFGWGNKDEDKTKIADALVNRFTPTPISFTEEDKEDWIKSLAPDIEIKRDSFDQIEDIIITGKSGKKHTISLQGYGEGVRVFIDDTNIGIGG